MKQGVYVMVFDERGYLLVVSRPQKTPNAPLIWTLPGGKVDSGENLLQAASRELWEETGLVRASHRLTFLDRFTVFKQEDLKDNFEVTAFASIEPVKATENLVAENYTQLEWIDPMEFFFHTPGFEQAKRVAYSAYLVYKSLIAPQP